MKNRQLEKFSTIFLTADLPKSSEIFKKTSNRTYLNRNLAVNLAVFIYLL
jgi:hypothetical protein